MQNIFITVYKNDYKKVPKHPDFIAYGSINGKLEKVGAGWTKDKNGKKYISFSFQTVPLSQAMNDTGLAPEAPTIPVVSTLPPKTPYTSAGTPMPTFEPNTPQQSQEFKNKMEMYEKGNAELDMETIFNNI